MICTIDQIEREVSQCCGTHVKRNNLRTKLKQLSNDTVQSRIERLRSEIRGLKLAGVKEQMLRPVYSKITELEVKLL